jgi:hypothetical protein
VPNIFLLIWKCKITPRIKFFAWLIILDRLNTRNMLVRRHFNVQPDSLCVLCADREEETIAHLFFQCDFAKACWDKIGIIWNLNDDLHNVIERTRQHAGLPLFMEIFMIAAGSFGRSETGKFFTASKLHLAGGSETSRMRQLFKHIGLMMIVEDLCCCGSMPCNFLLLLFSCSVSLLHVWLVLPFPSASLVSKFCSCTPFFVCIY